MGSDFVQNVTDDGVFLASVLGGGVFSTSSSSDDGNGSRDEVSWTAANDIVDRWSVTSKFVASFGFRRALPGFVLAQRSPSALVERPIF